MVLLVGSRIIEVLTTFFAVDMAGGLDFVLMKFRVRGELDIAQLASHRILVPKGSH
jgi:hypothetical protein